MMSEQRFMTRREGSLQASAIDVYAPCNLAVKPRDTLYDRSKESLASLQPVELDELVKDQIMKGEPLDKSLIHLVFIDRLIRELLLLLKCSRTDEYDLRATGHK
ncbi:uncharacterized protein LAESUDRAFT_119344 [Laetiporus sulphureus 93-53]|uniref:Uncharacterized protein n=1 Tax=Laetiporus sulphureus 93-53 TaxID=1314785 RepID=A0A165EJV4_9APHY|nr:uncharacterized protein LAESUDRAFT_119344 [Laetiporus sulphureus 93-53]KZT07204.1 hypothetical protein LAESUDRAFT_119344 [Laetiporus sulphureus 93-53]